MAQAKEALRVFISYARRDASAFAEELLCGLEVAGFEAFLDRHDIEAAVDWEERLGGLIQSADTIVFVITPAAIASKRCEWEVQRAEALSKRVIPVLLIDVPEDQTPFGLKRLNYIFFNKGHFAAPLGELVRALRVDVEWIREHTRLAEAARRWQARDKNEMLLLRGPELAAARHWLAAWKEPAPEPTDLHRAFINASDAAEGAGLKEERERLRRQARLQRFAGIVTASLLMVTLIGGWLVFDARRNLNQASARVLTHFALQAFEAGDHTRGLRLALIATAPQFLVDPLPEAEDALLANAAASRVVMELLGHEGRVLRADYFADDTRVLSLGEDGTARIWDVESGEQIALLRHGETARVDSARLSEDEQHIITEANDATARVWRSSDGAPVGRGIDYGGSASATFAVLVSADRVVTLPPAGDGEVRIWDVASGAQIGEGIPVDRATVSRNGTRLAVIPDGLRVARVLDGRTGAQIGQDFPLGDGLATVMISPDGAQIVLRENANALVARNLASGEIVATAAPLENSYSARYSSQFSMQYSEELDRFVHFASGATFDLRNSGATLSNYAGNHVSEDGARLALGIRASVKLWDRNGEVLWEHPVSGDDLAGFAVSEDEKRLLLWSAERAWIVDAATGRTSLPSFHQSTGLTAAAFTEDGQGVMTWGADGRIVLWRAEEERRMTLAHVDAAAAGDERIVAMRLSPDGTRALSYSRTDLKLWDASNGVLLHTIPAAARLRNVALAQEGEPDRFMEWHAEGVRMRSLATGAELFALPVGGLDSAALSEDGGMISTSDANTLHRWETAAGAPVGAAIPLFEGAYFVSADGRRVLTWNETSARLWNESDTALAELDLRQETRQETRRDSDQPPVLALSRDGARVFVAHGSAARLWLPDTDTEQPLTTPVADVREAFFSRDGARVLMLNASGGLHLWEISDASDTARHLYEAGAITARFSRAGDRVLIWRRDGLVLQRGLFGEKLGAEMRHLNVERAAYSLDGRRILTVSDEVARIWSAATGRQIGSDILAVDMNSNMTLSRDGRRIFAANATEARIWDVSWAQARPLAELRGEVCESMLNSRAYDHRMREDARGFRWPWQGRRIVRASARHVSDSDADFALVLRGREGEDVCRAARRR